jgi:hypothetical protein
LQPKPIVDTNIQLSVFKKGEVGDLQDYDRNESANGYLKLENRYTALPDSLFISTQFLLYSSLAKYGNKTKGEENGFFHLAHLLDYKLIPSEWTISLRRNNRVIDSLRILNKAYTSLSYFRQVVKKGDVLEVQVHKLHRVNYLNQLVPQELHKPLIERLKVKPPLKHFDIFDVDLSLPAEDFFKATKMEDEEKDGWQKKSKYLDYYTFYYDVKKLRIYNKTQSIFKANNTRTFFQFSNDIYAKNNKYRLSRILLKTFKSQCFDALGDKTIAYMQQLHKENPDWVVAPSLQTKHASKDLTQVLKKIWLFGQMFPIKKTIWFTQTFHEVLPLQKDGCKIELLIYYNVGKDFEVEIYFTR